MIQIRIYLDEKTQLFKNLKKRGFLDEYKNTLFIWLKLKPCIGELISIGASCVDDEKFKTFLNNRNKNIVLRITDLCQRHMRLKSDRDGIDCISLKCIEDDTANWLNN